MKDETRGFVEMITYWIIIVFSAFAPKWRGDRMGTVWMGPLFRLLDSLPLPKFSLSPYNFSKILFPGFTGAAWGAGDRTRETLVPTAATPIPFAARPIPVPTCPIPVMASPIPVQVSSIPVTTPEGTQ
jgi:hypothetical protein